MEEHLSVDARIGARIRRRRLQFKFDAFHLASLMGMTAERLRGCEDGREPLHARALLEFATHLDVPIAYFFADLSCPQANGHPRPIDDDLTHKLLDAFGRIDDSHLRDRFAFLVHAIAGCRA